MAKGNSQSMTALLRKALRECDSVHGVADATGLSQASLSRFMRGERSLRLDKADVLARYFGIECRPTRRRKG